MKKVILLSAILVLSLNVLAKNNIIDNCNLSTLEVTNSNNSGTGSLRQAVLDAVNGDEITFNASTNGNPIILSSAIQSDKSFTLTGNGANNTIIDGGENDRVFFFLTGSDISISGVTVQNGRVDQNNAIGGGIIANGNLTMSNCKVIGNTVMHSLEDSTTQGGGISSRGILTLINCLVAGNAALTNGGGIYNSTGDLYLINTTITGNRAFNFTASGTIISRGGGVYNAAGTFGTFELTNSIVWGNFALTQGPSVFGTITTANFSIVEENNLSTVGTGNFDGTNVDNDPQFKELAPFIPNNIPNTLGDYHLKVTSPMIDTGNNASNSEAFDLDNENRIVDGNLDSSSIIDLGCYEFDIPDAFITRWKTDNPGSSADDQIKLPIFGFLGAAYNYTVEWGDGTSDSYTTGGLGDVTHTYPAPGTYEVSITGGFPRIVFNGSGDKDKIVAIVNWGIIEWSSMSSAFEGCTNLVIEAIDTPDLNNVTACGEMFKDATSINTGLENWNMTNIISTVSMFENTTLFNGDITGWDVQNVQSTARMFEGATAFNRPIGSWQTTNLANTGGMFRDATSFNQDISNWDVSQVKDFRSMFENATNFNQDIGIWDTSSAETFANMFSGATSFDQDLGSWDVSSLSIAFPDSVDGANNMFEGVTLSTNNYDNLLIGWNTLDPGETAIPSSIPFSGGNSMYCEGANARIDLINTYNWAITDGGSDSLPIVAVCKNITVQLDASGNISILASDLDDGSSGGCGTLTFTASQTDFTCANVGSNNVSLMVTDVNGNSSSCVAIVTVEDLIDPIAICQNINISLDEFGVATILASDLDGGSTDNCGIDSLAIDIESFDCSTIGTNNVILTVTDVNGNNSSCVAIVTVDELIDPVAICQNINVALDEFGTVTILASDVDGGSTDACGIDSLSIDIDTFDCSTIGTNNVILTVTDVNGNSSSCVAIVTVEDLIDPVAICQNINVALDEFGTATILASDVDGGSTDACGIDSTAIDIDTFDCSTIGANNVTLTVTDVNGNSSSCVAIVTVEDLIDPVAICQNINVALDEFGAVSILASDVDGGSTDNCGIDSLAIDIDTFDCSHIGSNNITLTVTDVNGNNSSCVAMVTVEDNVDPEAICQNINIVLNESGTVTILASDIDGGSTDVCGIDSTAIDIDTFDCSHIGANNVTLTVTDLNGNSSSCVAIVTVEDLIDPTVICQNINVALDEFGTVTILASDVDGVSTDACGIDSIAIDIDTFDCSHIGANNVVLTVTDMNGNSSQCTAIVTVEDNILPELTCMDLTVQLDENGESTITPEDVIVSNTDSCGINSTSIDISFFSCSDVGTPVLVTVSSEDNHGNISTCTATVTVEDNIGPLFDIETLPDTQTRMADENGEYVLEDFTLDIITMDNCSAPLLPIVIYQYPQVGTILSPGIYSITISVKDEFSNLTEYDFELIVEEYLGITDNQIDLNTINLYPNPTNTVFYINNPKQISLEDLSIYDLMGRLVSVTNLKTINSQKAIDISTLASGNYLILIKGETGKIALQLIKE